MSEAIEYDLIRDRLDFIHMTLDLDETRVLLLLIGIHWYLASSVKAVRYSEENKSF